MVSTLYTMLHIWLILASTAAAGAVHEISLAQPTPGSMTTTTSGDGIITSVVDARVNDDDICPGILAYGHNDTTNKDDKTTAPATTHTNLAAVPPWRQGAVQSTSGSITTTISSNKAARKIVHAADTCPGAHASGHNDTTNKDDKTTATARTDLTTRSVNVPTRSARLLLLTMTIGVQVSLQALAAAAAISTRSATFQQAGSEKKVASEDETDHLSTSERAAVANLVALKKKTPTTNNQTSDTISAHTFLPTCVLRLALLGLAATLRATVALLLLLLLVVVVVVVIPERTCGRPRTLRAASHRRSTWSKQLSSLAVALLLFLVPDTTKATFSPPNTFRLGAMFPHYKAGSASPPFSVDNSGQKRFAAARLAIEEINNKTDGILDDVM